MKQNSKPKVICAVCSQEIDRSKAVPIELIRPSLLETIQSHGKSYDPSCFICLNDMRLFQSEHIQKILEKDVGEVTELEKSVARSIDEHELVSLQDDSDDKYTFGEKLSDRIAAIGGSWGFISSFLIFLSLWIFFNVTRSASNAPDPYPFILLNLILSCIAALQAPIIMMSQNRQEAKDRERAENDYKINLKAELEIRHLHEKLDHLLINQWQRLAEIQQTQMEFFQRKQ